jgi:hypothetical protein
MTDSLAERLGFDITNPTYLAAKAQAKADYQNAEIRHCKNGCTNYYRPGEDTPFTGFGKAGCSEPECA